MENEVLQHWGVKGRSGRHKGIGAMAKDVSTKAKAVGKTANTISKVADTVSAVKNADAKAIKSKAVNSKVAKKVGNLPVAEIRKAAEVGTLAVIGVMGISSLGVSGTK
jgi:hypothetical protein